MNNPSWNDKFNMVRDWCSVETNKLCMSTIIDGRKAGVWAYKQRQEKKKCRLSDDKIIKLETIRGWYWERDLDEEWNEHFSTLRDWCSVENHELVHSTIINGRKAGVWAYKQRQEKKKCRLSYDKIIKLETIRDWYW